MNREDQKKEALARLKILESKGMKPCVYNNFKKKNELYYSFQTPTGCALYKLDNTVGIHNIWMNALKEFEEFWKALVYHVVYDRFEEDEVIVFFYISNQRHEWDDDREKLEEGCPFVFAYSLTDPTRSQYGNIDYVIKGGGIIFPGGE